MQKKVLLIGVLLMLLKGLAFYITGSNAILSDALESLVNISSGSFALYSLWYASKPTDENHPYGHGKIEFISGLLEGVLVFIAGVSIIGKGAYNLVYPQNIDDFLIGMILAGSTGLVNYFMGRHLKSTGEQKKSMIMMSEGTHLMSDGYTSFALILGVLVVWLTGWVWVDNVLAIGFGFYILWASYKILRESIAGIMDEVDEALIESIINILEENRKESWIDVHNLRAVKYGRSVHVDCHVTLPWYDSLEQSHERVDEVEALMKETFDQSIEFNIHADPCVPTSCELCLIKACNHRKKAFKEKVGWNKKNVMGLNKHTLLG